VHGDPFACTERETGSIALRLDAYRVIYAADSPPDLSQSVARIHAAGRA
jgi:hypothetical protein